MSRVQRVLKRKRGPRSKQDLTTLQDWLARQTSPVVIQGRESLAWDKKFESDLFCLSTAYEEKDAFSRFCYERGLKWYHDLIGHRIHDHPSVKTGPASAAFDKHLISYSDARLAGVIWLLGTLLASLLPSASVFILYFIHDPVSQLGTIVALTSVFSFAVAAITRATTVEIFIAAAGFTAVLVVFLSNGNCDVN